MMDSESMRLKIMICNMCVKQDVCPLKEATKYIEKDFERTNPHLELDCKHRHAGTTDELQRMREETE